jgi:hypothetical protein
VFLSCFNVIAGSVIPRQRQEQPALLLPRNIKKPEATVEDYEMNIFEFFPDPVHLVETLKIFDRGDMASSLFVKLFERYVTMKAQPDQDPMKYAPSPNELE